MPCYDYQLLTIQPRGEGQELPLNRFNTFIKDIPIVYFTNQFWKRTLETIYNVTLVSDSETERSTMLLSRSVRTASKDEQSNFPNFQKKSKIKFSFVIFGFSMKNNLKCVQTSLVLVRWGVRKPLWSVVMFRKFCHKFQFLYSSLQRGKYDVIYHVSSGRWERKSMAVIIRIIKMSEESHQTDWASVFELARWLRLNNKVFLYFKKLIRVKEPY